MRFAPSPTGHLHVGGARTALFNWLFARHHGGAFLLRIEDTDRDRSTDEAIHADPRGDDLARARLGRGGPGGRRRVPRLLPADEPVRDLPGPRRAPPRRRPGLPLLLHAGGARRPARGGPGPRARPSATTAAAATSRPVPASPRRSGSGSPIAGTTVVPDLIHGDVTFDRATLDDWILVRSDGTPTYNFCVVVDDVTMKITHVIRGNDHLSNTPKQILCYEALGYPQPVFAHIPMILGPDRKRLSKRHGATSVLAFRDEGFLPEAMVNYLARLGWAHGDQEVFTRDELIRFFDLGQVGATPAIFDRTKLEWLNQVWMKKLAEDPAGRRRLATRELVPHLERLGIAAPREELLLATVLNLGERTKTLVEMADQGRFYFEAPDRLRSEAMGKLLTPAHGRARWTGCSAGCSGLEPVGRADPGGRLPSARRRARREAGRPGPAGAACPHGPDGEPAAVRHDGGSGSRGDVPAAPGAPGRSRPRSLGRWSSGWSCCRRASCSRSTRPATSPASPGRRSRRDLAAPDRPPRRDGAAPLRDAAHRGRAPAPRGRPPAPGADAPDREPVRGPPDRRRGDRADPVVDRHDDHGDRVRPGRAPHPLPGDGHHPGRGHRDDLHRPAAGVPHLRLRAPARRARVRDDLPRQAAAPEGPRATPCSGSG